MADSSEQPGWERNLLKELASEQLKERRRARRWGIFFKLLTFAYLFAVLGLLLPSDLSERQLGKERFTALVNVEGVIAADAQASADNIITGLRDAFEDKGTKGVILRINSPGGSPVQAGYVNDEIVRLRKKYPKIPLYAVVTDVCASGGYYIAAAADRIYVDKASIVGSIGVLMDGFGFVDGMQKLGIERRLLTAGEHKGILDPFSPAREFDREHVQTLLKEMHQQFIDVVKRGRGDRLVDDPQLFSGLFWSGQRSIELGLADELGSSSYVAREVIGEEEIVDFTPTEQVWDRLASRLGASAARTFGQLMGLGGAVQLR